MTKINDLNECDGCGNDLNDDGKCDYCTECVLNFDFKCDMIEYCSEVGVDDCEECIYGGLKLKL